MKLYRKYSTRDLLALEKRGNSKVANELLRRAIFEGDRRGPKPASPLIEQSAFFGRKTIGG